MKKLFTLALAALFSASMLADTAILSWYLGENGTEATAANSITGAVGSAAEGWTIAMTGNLDKNWAGTSSKISYNGTGYKTLKNSNGVQNTVTLPEGLYASKVVFYAVTNNTETVGFLKEFDGKTAKDTVFSLTDYDNPTIITKELEIPKNEFTFNFGGRQVCFIAIVTYSDQVPEVPEPPTPHGLLSWHLGENGAEATAANSITGATGSAAEGWTIAITGNLDKNWGAGGKISYNGTIYKTLKNSNGAQNTVTLPDGLYASKVVFYAVTNNDTVVGLLKEFDGKTAKDTVFSLMDFDNPTIITKELDIPKNEFTFTFGGKQVCFIAAVTFTDEAPVIASGTCGAEGDNLTWTLSCDSVLTISGTGAMAEWISSSSSVPWYSNKSTIRSVIIEDGVTSIVDWAFENCTNLISVTIPNSFKSIGARIFSGCTALTSVTIPNSVTSIEKYAFFGCSALTSIEIPNSVTSIAEGAFASCLSLTSIEIPNSVTSIAYSAFGYCTALTSIAIPNSVTNIGDWAFYGCSSLTTIEIPNSVTSIGRDAFLSCNSLTSIEIPNSVTSIGNETFSGCSGLTSVTIPNSVTSIGDHAFYWCIGLPSVTIPNSVTSIGNEAFSGCTGLTSITNLATTPQAVSTYVFGNPSSNTAVDYSSCTLYVPAESVEAYKAADVWKEFTNILPIEETEGINYTTLADIYNMAADSAFTLGAFDVVYVPSFQNGSNMYIKDSTGACVIYKVNYGLQAGDHVEAGLQGKVHIYNGLYEITPISTKEELTITSGEAPAPIVATEVPSLTNMNQYVVYKGVSFSTDTAFVEGKRHAVNGIWNGQTITFYNQYYMSDTLSAGKTYNIIAVNTIYGTIPQAYPLAVEEVSSDTPDSCIIASGTCGENLTWELGCDSVLTISGTGAMKDWYSSVSVPWYNYRDNIAYLSLPDGLTNIGAGAFGLCKALTSVTIPNSVTNIGQLAFNQCSGLSSISIPNSVTSIGYDAFYLCESLTSPLYTTNVFAFLPYSHSGSYSIPNGIESIVGGAFKDRRSLTSVAIPNTVTSIGKEAFYRCNIMSSIEVAPDNANYCSADGVLFDKEKTTLIQYPGGKYGAYTIPNSVTLIEKCAFYGCYHLSSVEIPNSVTNIGSGAFGSCSILVSVTIGNSVTSIGDNAFIFCSKLTSVTNYATIPQIINTKVFGDVDLSSRTLYVPKESIEAYQKADVWKEFGTILAIEETPTPCLIASGTCGENLTWKLSCDSVLTISGTGDMIDFEAFQYNATPWPEYRNTIKSVIIGEGITRIGNYAFYYCHNIISVDIPNSVTSIGMHAFRECNSLISVTIPDNVTSIGQGAFEWCEKLTSFVVTDNNPQFCSMDGVLFNKDKTTLICFPISKAVSSYVIPNSVTSIGLSAFGGCESLTSIEIPNSVISIRGAAFAWCRGLTTIVIPNSVTSIENQVFYGCSNLTSVEIPNSVTIIGSIAFSYCPVLTYFTNYAIVPQSIVAMVFENVDLSTITLYVPAESIEAYQAADVWREFGTIKAIMPQPTTIELSDNDDDIENVLDSLIGDTTDITINRTLSKNGSFNTLCLPFSLSASEIEASDLAGCELFEYDSNAFKDSTLYLYIKTATAIEAGKPYLIRWADGDTITQLNFTNVTIAAGTGQSVGTNVQIVGTLGQTTINGNNYLFVGANNTLYWPAVDTNLKGFRAYFNINDSIVPLVKRARLVIQPEPTSKVDKITYVETGLKDLAKSGYQDATITNMPSGSEYLINGNCGVEYIQMRTNNNNSGLVTTKSAGSVLSVEITFNEKTTDRKVYIYGSNTAFTSPTELYAEGLTPLDSIGAADATKKRTISGNYRYIGIRSSSGAIFIDEIDIEWGNFEEKTTTILKFKSDTAEVEVGETVALEVERDGNDAITWMTSDASIATVANGIVTGVKEGTVKITATANNISDECTVTVKKAATPDELPVKSVAEFIAAQGGKCKLIGIVGKIDNDLYGNFNLTDNSGTIYVYGLLTASGESKKFNTLGVAEGDTLTVIAETYMLYNDKPEVINAIFVEVKKGSGVTPTHHDGPLDVNYAEAAYYVKGTDSYWEIFAGKLIEGAYDLQYPVLIMDIDNTDKTHFAGEFNVFNTVLYMSDNDSVQFTNGEVSITCVKPASDTNSGPAYSFAATLRDEAGKEYAYTFETKVIAYDPETEKDITLADTVSGGVPGLEPDTISIAEALQIGMALDSMATSTETYTIEGYVINAGTFSSKYKYQTWYMADDPNTAYSDFQAYQCYPMDGADTTAVYDGSRVRMTGQLQKYYNRQTATYVVEMKRVQAIILSVPEIDTITVAEALAIGEKLAVGATNGTVYTIRGYVSSIEIPYDERYKDQSFYIADDISSVAYSAQTGGFHVYRGIPADSMPIKEGAYVELTTSIKKYSDAKIENAESNILVTVLKEAPECRDLAGACGENLTWTLNTCDSALAISGTGAMYNYSKGEAPWSRFGVTSVNLGKGLTAIGKYDLYACYMPSIIIPASVTSIAASAFSRCPALTDIFVEARNSQYSSIDGVLYSKDKKTILAHPIGRKGAYEIPDGVDTIGVAAFNACRDITSITLPNSATTIKEAAFFGCGISSMTIPASVDSIERIAFVGCMNLTTIVNHAVVPQKIDSTVFEGVNLSACALYVPAESVKDYQTANVWKDFGSIIPMQAEEVTEQITDVETQPQDNSVIVTWPVVASADTYTLEIKKNGELICTLTFSSDGRLMGIAFAPARNGGNPALAAVKTDNGGLRFTVTGLNSGTQYNLDVIAKDAANQTIKTYQTVFTTTGTATGLESIQPSAASYQKILLDGHIYLMYNGTMYDVQGKKVR